MDLQRKVGLPPVVGIKDRTRAESGSQLLQGDALGKSSSEAKICSATESGSLDPLVLGEHPEPTTGLSEPIIWEDEVVIQPQSFSHSKSKRKFDALALELSREMREIRLRTCTESTRSSASTTAFLRKRISSSESLSKKSDTRASTPWFEPVFPDDIHIHRPSFQDLVVQCAFESHYDTDCFKSIRKYLNAKDGVYRIDVAEMTFLIGSLNKLSMTSTLCQLLDYFLSNEVESVLGASRLQSLAMRTYASYQYLWRNYIQVLEQYKQHSDSLIQLRHLSRIYSFLVYAKLPSGDRSEKRRMQYEQFVHYVNESVKRMIENILSMYPEDSEEREFLLKCQDYTKMTQLMVDLIEPINSVPDKNFQTTWSRESLGANLENNSVEQIVWYERDQEESDEFSEKTKYSYFESPDEDDLDEMSVNTRNIMCIIREMNRMRCNTLSEFFRKVGDPHPTN